MFKFSGIPMATLIGLEMGKWLKLDGSKSTEKTDAGVWNYLFLFSLNSPPLYSININYVYQSVFVAITNISKAKWLK